MPVRVRTEPEIELMRESGRKLALVHEEMKKAVRPGISTAALNEVGEAVIAKLGGIPNFKNYNGFPAAVCVSVNDEIVHGIPSRDRILTEGDIVSLDAGLVWKGWHSDAARTWGVGVIGEEAKMLIEVTRQSFFEGLRCAKRGGHLYDISAAVGEYAYQHGCSAVRELAGHGIGMHLHEAPAIPNFPQKGRGILLVRGMSLAVEPMLNLGEAGIEPSDDGWTIRTADGSLSAHYENTIVITDGAPEVLTMTEEEKEEEKSRGNCLA